MSTTAVSGLAAWVWRYPDSLSFSQMFFSQRKVTPGECLPGLNPPGRADQDRSWRTSALWTPLLNWTCLSAVLSHTWRRETVRQDDNKCQVWRSCDIFFFLLVVSLVFGLLITLQELFHNLCKDGGKLWCVWAHALLSLTEGSSVPCWWWSGSQSLLPAGRTGRTLNAPSESGKLSRRTKCQNLKKHGKHICNYLPPELKHVHFLWAACTF